MLYYKDDNFYSQAKTCNSTDRQPTSHIAISIYSLSYLNIYNSFRWIHVNTLFLNQYPWIGILYRADLSNCFTSISLNCTLGSLDIGKGLSENIRLKKIWLTVHVFNEMFYSVYIKNDSY